MKLWLASFYLHCKCGFSFEFTHTKNQFWKNKTNLMISISKSLINLWIRWLIALCKGTYSNCLTSNFIYRRWIGHLQSCLVLDFLSNTRTSFATISLDPLDSNFDQQSLGCSLLLIPSLWASAAIKHGLVSITTPKDFSAPTRLEEGSELKSRGGG
jgi:hypothetical protein